MAGENYQYYNNYSSHQQYQQAGSSGTRIDKTAKRSRSLSPFTKEIISIAKTNSESFVQKSNEFIDELLTGEMPAKKRQAVLATQESAKEVIKSTNEVLVKLMERKSLPVPEGNPGSSNKRSSALIMSKSIVASYSISFSSENHN